MSLSRHHRLARERALEAEAAAWIAEREAGFAPGQAAAYERWLGKDSRHAAALARVEAACGILRTLGPAQSRAAGVAPRRRPAGSVGTAFAVLSALAAIVLLGVGAWQFIEPAARNIPVPMPTEDAPFSPPAAFGTPAAPGA